MALDRPVYDTIGRGYQPIRSADPRIASRIDAALGDARTVLNIGAGTGSYEPADRWVLAVEPSSVMIEQRPLGAAPVVQAAAEDLPLASGTVDATMGVLTIQHWHDVAVGLKELIRVTRDRIVLMTMDVSVLEQLWIVSDYFPALAGPHMDRFPTIATLCDLLPNATSEVLPIPSDCSDRFLAALWARPHELLDPAVRAGTSPWHDLQPDELEHGLERLRRDLDDGTWNRRYGSLLERDVEDVGVRIITSVLPRAR